MSGSRSKELMRRAEALFPGGVNSPVRAFRGVGGEPFVAQRGHGAMLVDVDGNEFIDYVLSWGALPLGHAHPQVLEAIARAMSMGTSFGVPNAYEVELGELIRERMPHMQMMRFVSSGTEATMSAVRLARAATGREHILKFDGCYHGHADSFLVHAGSGVATFGLPNSPGVPASLAALTLTCEFNDVSGVRETFAQRGSDVAAVIVEPVVGNAGFIMPTADFLATLRRECDSSGALLIFDEVMTGFRVAPGGASELCGVVPDLTTLGKVIGGGLPVAAYGGSTALMKQIAPDGPVYQAGTLSGNPLSMAAGIATLQLLTRDLHDRIAENTSRLTSGLLTAAKKHGVPLSARSCGSMWGFFFTDAPVHSFAQARTGNSAHYRQFFHAALGAGVYLAPSPFEAAFMSSAHEGAVIDTTLQKLEDALRVLAP